MAALVSGRSFPVSKEGPAGPRAATRCGPANADPPDAGLSIAAKALILRDEALAELDDGDGEVALAIAWAGLATLEATGLAGGIDAAAVLVAMAEIEESTSRFDEAAATAVAAITILDSVLSRGKDDDGLLLWCQAHERLAGLERMAGEFGAAAARLSTVLDRASSALGETSRPVVSAANALGMVHKYAGDFDAAEAAYRRAVAAADSGPGADPLILAGLLHNLGGLAHSRGDFAAGIPLAELGLALRTDGLGADHPDVARDLNALGALYHAEGRLGDAANAYRRALAVFEDRYGPEHFEVAMTCANIAVLDGDQGNWQAAESLGRRSLRILGAILGPQDAEVGLTLLNLAVAVSSQGRNEEAAALTARAAAILQSRLPRDHPHVVAADDALERFGTPQ